MFKNIDKEDKNRYLKVIRISFITLLISEMITLIIFKNLNPIIGIAYGYLIGLLGFISIIASVNAFEINAHYRGKIIGSFMLRFLFYAISLSIGGLIKLNMIAILFGFLITNFCLKILVILEERGILH